MSTKAIDSLAKGLSNPAIVAILPELVGYGFALLDCVITGKMEDEKITRLMLLRKAKRVAVKKANQ